MENFLIEQSELSNGIRIVTERMPFVRSVSLGIFIQAGSANESEIQYGLAHFLEHMLFKGTHKRTAKDIALSLESYGGGMNGATGKELSLYNAYCLGEHLHVAIDVLFDILFHSVFDEEAMNIEKQVVLSEISHAIEDPEEFTYDQFYHQLFPNHPLGSFIYGTEENIKRFSAQDLDDFQNKFYTPDRMVVSVAGDVDHSRIVQLVEQQMQSVDRAKSGRGNKFPQFSGVNADFKMRMKHFHQSHIMLGTRTCSAMDEKKYVLALLDLLLGSGMSSRLFQNIREKYGFTYSVYSFVDLMQTVGVFGMYMACDRKRTDDSVELLMNEIRAVKDGNITQTELDMLKRQIQGSLVLGLESNSRRMKRNGEIDIYNGKNYTVDEILAIVNRITIADMVDLANEIYYDSNINLTIISP